MGYTDLDDEAGETPAISHARPCRVAAVFLQSLFLMLTAHRIQWGLGARPRDAATSAKASIDVQQVADTHSRTQRIWTAIGIPSRA